MSVLVLGCSKDSTSTLRLKLLGGLGQITRRSRLARASCLAHGGWQGSPLPLAWMGAEAYPRGHWLQTISRGGAQSKDSHHGSGDALPTRGDACLEHPVPEPSLVNEGSGNSAPCIQVSVETGSVETPLGEVTRWRARESRSFQVLQALTCHTPRRTGSGGEHGGQGHSNASVSHGAAVSQGRHLL